MSADAKVWFEPETGSWNGIHDATCVSYGGHLNESSFDLVRLLQDIEACENKGRPMRWLLKQYENGLGLAGYIC